MKDLRLTVRHNEEVQTAIEYLKSEVGLNISYVIRRYLMNLYETEKARRSV